MSAENSVSGTDMSLVTLWFEQKCTKKVFFIELALNLFSSFSRNISGPVGWWDATRLWRSSECPLRHGGRHPLPSSYFHKLPPLRFGAQQRYSSTRPDRGGGSCSSSRSWHPVHQRLHVQHRQQRQQPRSVSWRLRTDGTQ